MAHYALCLWFSSQMTCSEINQWDAISSHNALKHWKCAAQQWFRFVDLFVTRSVNINTKAVQFLQAWAVRPSLSLQSKTHTCQCKFLPMCRAQQWGLPPTYVNDAVTPFVHCACQWLTVFTKLKLVPHSSFPSGSVTLTAALGGTPGCFLKNI